MTTTVEVGCSVRKSKAEEASCPLSSWRATLDRAEKQLSELIDTHHDFESHETAVTFFRASVLFVGYSVMVGEVVHQVRSALEHIICRLFPIPRTGSRVSLFWHSEGKTQGRCTTQAGEMLDGIDPVTHTVGFAVTLVQRWVATLFRDLTDASTVRRLLCRVANGIVPADAGRQ